MPKYREVRLVMEIAWSAGFHDHLSSIVMQIVKFVVHDIL